MIDCKITVNFLREKQRMCDSFKNGCILCPLREASKHTEHTCSSYIFVYPECSVDIVQKWSDEHPIKTRLDDVKEKHPNVEMLDGTPMFYPLRLGYCKDCDKCIVRGLIKRCWDEPVDGGATGREVE